MAAGDIVTTEVCFLKLELRDGTAVRLCDGGFLDFASDGTSERYESEHPVFGTIANAGEHEVGFGDQAERGVIALAPPGEGTVPLEWLRDQLAAHPATQALFNVADRATMLQPDGSTAVTADSDKVGTLSDLVGDYDFTSPSETDSPTAASGLTFSGSAELRAAPADPPASAAMFMLVVTTDAQAVLANDSTDGRYSGVIESGSGSPAHSDGAPDNYVDGGTTSITTRGGLFTAVADGEAHIVELRGIPLDTWANLEVAGFAGGGGLYRLSGVAVPLCVFDDDHADIAAARALALRYGNAMLAALSLADSAPALTLNDWYGDHLLDARLRTWAGEPDADAKTVSTAELLDDLIVDTYEQVIGASGSRLLELGFIARTEKFFLRNEGNVCSSPFHQQQYPDERGFDNCTDKVGYRAWGALAPARGDPVRGGSRPNYGNVR
ncbi:hypothetical protein AAG604_10545 [Citromicrobium bathyomarinum]